jgi:carbamoyltransferase
MRLLSSEFETSRDLAVSSLVAGGILGWFQGRSEIGPRALGNRSILADPRNSDLKNRLNDEVKHRESWRPYAPVMLAEHAEELLDFKGTPPAAAELMLMAATMRLSDVSFPAVTHVDGSTRPQLVTKKSNSRLFDLLTAFKEATGWGVLLNTSFNDSGEPIVESPTDALKTFDSLSLQGLVMGKYFIEK